MFYMFIPCLGSCCAARFQLHYSFRVTTDQSLQDHLASMRDSGVVLTFSIDVYNNDETSDPGEEAKKVVSETRYFPVPYWVDTSDPLDLCVSPFVRIEENLDVEWCHDSIAMIERLRRHLYNHYKQPNNRVLVSTRITVNDFTGYTQTVVIRNPLVPDRFWIGCLKRRIGWSILSWFGFCFHSKVISSMACPTLDYELHKKVSLVGPVDSDTPPSNTIFNSLDSYPLDDILPTVLNPVQPMYLNQKPLFSPGADPTTQNLISTTGPSVTTDLQPCTVQGNSVPDVPPPPTSYDPSFVTTTTTTTTTGPSVTITDLQPSIVPDVPPPPVQTEPPSSYDPSFVTTTTTTTPTGPSVTTTDLQPSSVPDVPPPPIETGLSSSYDPSFVTTTTTTTTTGPSVTTTDLQPSTIQGNSVPDVPPPPVQTEPPSSYDPTFMTASTAVSTDQVVSN